MSDDPAKQAWQTSVVTAAAPALEDVRAGADKLYRFVRWRNIVEYAACVLVVVGFSSYIFWLPHLLQKVGSALVVVAVFYVAWQLHRRASAVAPDSAGAMPILEFARGQLVRQRDALRSVFWWYLLPFVPGLLLISVGTESERAGETSAIVMPGIGEGVMLACMGAVFAGIWWFNQRIARKLQTRIDEIDALMGRGE
ncbi:MAG TPA: hypothetical protein VNR60_03240 [Croceibacterium sp.]|nr:hypothetical protein [Croceibacterium sp.]